MIVVGVVKYIFRRQLRQTIREFWPVLTL